MLPTTVKQALLLLDAVCCNLLFRNRCCFRHLHLQPWLYDHWITCEKKLRQCRKKKIKSLYHHPFPFGRIAVSSQHNSPFSFLRIHRGNREIHLMGKIPLMFVLSVSTHSWRCVSKTALQAFISFHFTRPMFLLPIPILYPIKLWEGHPSAHYWTQWAIKCGPWPEEMIGHNNWCTIFWLLFCLFVWFLIASEHLHLPLGKQNPVQSQCLFSSNPFLTLWGDHDQSDLPAVIKAFPRGNCHVTHLQSSWTLTLWAQVTTSREHREMSACWFYSPFKSGRGFSNGHQHVLLHSPLKCPQGSSRGPSFHCLPACLDSQAIAHCPWTGRNQCREFYHCSIHPSLLGKQHAVQPTELICFYLLWSER